MPVSDELKAQITVVGAPEATAAMGKLTAAMDGAEKAHRKMGASATAVDPAMAKLSRGTTAAAQGGALMVRSLTEISMAVGVMNPNLARLVGTISQTAAAAAAMGTAFGPWGYAIAGVTGALGYLIPALADSNEKTRDAASAAHQAGTRYQDLARHLSETAEKADILRRSLAGLQTEGEAAAELARLDVAAAQRDQRRQQIEADLARLITEGREAGRVDPWSGRRGTAVIAEERRQLNRELARMAESESELQATRARIRRQAQERIGELGQTEGPVRMFSGGGVVDPYERRRPGGGGGQSAAERERAAAILAEAFPTADERTRQANRDALFELVENVDAVGLALDRAGGSAQELNTYLQGLANDNARRLEDMARAEERAGMASLARAVEENDKRKRAAQEAMDREHAALESSISMSVDATGGMVAALRAGGKEALKSWATDFAWMQGLRALENLGLAAANWANPIGLEEHLRAAALFGVAAGIAGGGVAIASAAGGGGGGGKSAAASRPRDFGPGDQSQGPSQVNVYLNAPHLVMTEAEGGRLVDHMLGAARREGLVPGGRRAA